MVGPPKEERRMMEGRRRKKRRKKNKTYARGPVEFRGHLRIFLKNLSVDYWFFFYVLLYEFGMYEFCLLFL